MKYGFLVTFEGKGHVMVYVDFLKFGHRLPLYPGLVVF